MTLKYGRRILGDEEYNRQMAKQAETVKTHGGPTARYGSRIVGTPAADPVMVWDDATAPILNAEPDAPTAEATSFTVADIKQALEAEPKQVERLALLELTSTSPRKGALEALLTAARKGGEDCADLVTDLEAALTRED